MHWTMFFQPYWFKQSLCGRQTSQMDHNNPALGWQFNHNLLRDLWNREVRLCVLSCFSHVRLFASLWILACQAPLSMGFPRQEYWSGLPCPSPGDLPVQPRDQTQVSHIVGRCFYCLSHLGSPTYMYTHTHIFPEEGHGSPLQYSCQYSCHEIQ